MAVGYGILTGKAGTCVIMRVTCMSFSHSTAWLHKQFAPAPNLPVSVSVYVLVCVMFRERLGWELPDIDDADGNQTTLAWMHRNKASLREGLDNAVKTTRRCAGSVRMQGGSHFSV